MDIVLTLFRGENDPTYGRWDVLSVDKADQWLLDNLSSEAPNLSLLVITGFSNKESEFLKLQELLATPYDIDPVSSDRAVAVQEMTRLAGRVYITRDVDIPAPLLSLLENPPYAASIPWQAVRGAVFQSRKDGGLLTDADLRGR